MARELTPTYEAATNTAGIPDVDLLYMRVPKKPNEADDLEFYFSTDQTITVGEQIWECRINQFPQAIKHSLGKSPDGGDVALANADNVLGWILGDPDRDVDKTYIIAARAYVVSSFNLPAVWESDEYFAGYMRNPRVGREIRFQLISDMYRRGGQIGGEAVPQRCRFVFNVNGNHPLGGRCRWTVAQGGNPLFCNHDEADCAAHGNRFRYGGVAVLKAVARAQVSDGNPNDDPFGNGWPDGTHPRPHPRLDFDYPFMRRNFDVQ